MATLPPRRAPIKILNCAPEKRSYLSIINDYDPHTAICELIDNPVDIWRKRGGVLNLSISFNLKKGSLIIEDDSGGIPESELHFVVRPGASGNLQDENTIGIFGVGSKRSVIALAKQVSITTRPRREKRTFLLEYGDSWLRDPSWDLPCYEAASECEEGHTKVELNSLWHTFNEEDVRALRQHVGETYARFLKNSRLNLTIDGVRVDPIILENWAYPPDFSPLQIEGPIPTADGKTIEFKAVGGLITEPAYSSGEYGVYFYFNDRLIAKALKTPEVGFAKAFAGVPHHSHSIARVIVSLDGPAKYMPWNSSKSGVHFGHETYKRIAETIIDMTTCYAKIASRKLKEWRDDIFPHKSGEIGMRRVNDFGTVKKCLPEIPRARPNYREEITDNNKAIIDEKPWAEVIVDGVVVIQNVQKQKIRTKNRFTLVLLDSLVEMGLKEYLVNESGRNYSDVELKSIVGSREKLILEVLKYKKLPEQTITILERLSTLRGRVVSEKRPPDVPDVEIEQLRNTVQSCLKTLLGIRFPSR